MWLESNLRLIPTIIPKYYSNNIINALQSTKKVKIASMYFIRCMHVWCTPITCSLHIKCHMLYALCHTSMSNAICQTLYVEHRSLYVKHWTSQIICYTSYFVRSSLFTVRRPLHTTPVRRMHVCHTSCKSRKHARHALILHIEFFVNCKVMLCSR